MLRTINKTSLVHAPKLRSLFSAELLRQGISVRLLFNAKYAFALHKSQKPAFFVCMFFYAKSNADVETTAFYLLLSCWYCVRHTKALTRALANIQTHREWSVCIPSCLREHWISRIFAVGTHSIECLKLENCDATSWNCEFSFSLRHCLPPLSIVGKQNRDDCVSFSTLVSALFPHSMCVLHFSLLLLFSSF